MNTFSIWPEFGFRENPYDNRKLEADESGDKLLVGREDEVRRIARRIGSSGTHPSVEGMAGVGKSSLIAVTGYRMMMQCLAANNGTLFVPAGGFFQASESLDRFEEDVYREIAQTLIANVDAFRRVGHAVPDLPSLDKWLNSPQYRSGGINTPIGGANAGSSPNSTAGFQESGFPAAVRKELVRIFPSPDAGGIICVLDNLELLKTSGRAREVLEALRDRVFDLPGLRWVLCGSRGIVSRARSQRLSGVFDPPMPLGPIPQEASAELIETRVRYYGLGEPYPPVGPEAFATIYSALNQNLRDALAWSQQFSDYLYESYIVPDEPLPSVEEAHEMAETWLLGEAKKAQRDASAVQPRHWVLFDDLSKHGGTASAGDWRRYSFSTQQQFSSSVTALVSSNLAIREVDPDNAARSIATMTPQGWLVYYYRARYEPPEGSDS